MNQINIIIMNKIYIETDVNEIIISLYNDLAPNRRQNLCVIS